MNKSIEIHRLELYTDHTSFESFISMVNTILTKNGYHHVCTVNHFPWTREETNHRGWAKPTTGAAAVRLDFMVRRIPKTRWISLHFPRAVP